VKRLRTGVIGCGLVAQVMHLPFLRELSDRYEVRALCDISPRALAHAGAMFPEAGRHARAEDLLAEELDAVLVLTPGSHAPAAIAAAETGRHVFVEKPMCIDPGEGRLMIDAAEASNVVLMVGYMKRYDPAYEQLHATLDRAGLTYARITTLESPLEPYVAHLPLSHGGPDVDAELLASLAADDALRVEAALPGADELSRRVYRVILLDSMIHELNGIRHLLGEPSALQFARFSPDARSVTTALTFGDVECAAVWIDLPGIARYQQDWAFYGPDARSSLRFPSPFLRNEPTQLILEGGELGTAHAWETVHTVSYDEAFKRELVEFHTAAVEGLPARTDGADGLRDVVLCQSIARAHMSGGALPDPTMEVART